MFKTEIEARIADYMSRQFLFAFDGQKVTPETNLFAAGCLDSFGFVELLTFLESEYAIKFTDEELLSNRLNSLAGLTAVVEGKVNHVG